MSEPDALLQVNRSQSFAVGLVGTDLATTLTPALHEREADELGLRYVYKIIDIEVLDLTLGVIGEIVRAAAWFGFAGLNVTHPCKQTVLPHLDELSPEAAAVRAVNTVVFENGRTVGHNTDCTGFAKAIRHGLPNADLDRVVLLGAGGAGSAVAHALLDLGAGHVVVVDVRGGTAVGLARTLGDRFGRGRISAAPVGDIAAQLAAAGGIVNATPAGMSERADLPIPEQLLRADVWVADIVYRPLATPLLRAARQRGCQTLSGGGMAVFQAAHAFHLFTGVEPDEERMLASFDDLQGHLNRVER